MDFVYREDCLNEEEFLKLKEMAESKRGLWLRKAAEHGSREAQYYLGILLYSDSKKEALDWLNKAQSQAYQPVENALLQRQKMFLKTGLIGKIFNKKSSEDREASQKAERQEDPEWKDFFYFNFSSKQKEVLGLDAEVMDYESFKDGHFIK